MAIPGFRYFVVMGVLAFLSLAFPTLVIIGAMAFVLPGLFLGLAPTLFLYPLAVVCVSRLLEGTPRLLRWALAAIIIAVPTFGVPLYLNRPVERAFADLTAQDRTADAVKTPDVVALLESPQEARVDRSDSLCSSLCQRLLFNGAVKRVIVAKPSAQRIDDIKAQTAFAIERRETCPPAPIAPSGAWPGDGRDYRDTLEDSIKARVVAGECLVRVAGDISDAGMLFADRIVKAAVSDNFNRPWSLTLDTVSARRLELLERDAGVWRIVDRKTQVKAEPLFTPLLIGPVSGYGLQMASGFIRRSKAENAFEYDLPREYRRLFAEAVRLPNRIAGGVNLAPAAELAELRGLVSRALRNPSQEAQAGFDAVESYLKLVERAPEIGDADIALMAEAIRDLRVTRFFPLHSVIRKLGPRAAMLADPLMDRLMTSPLPRGRDQVQTMSSAISALPPGAARPISGRIDALTREPGRRGAAWRAIARMGDGGPSAVPRYVEMISTDLTEGARKRDHDDRDAIIGALQGVCLMGNEARGAVDAMLTVIADDVARRKGDIGAQGLLAAEALARMGEAERLDAALGVGKAKSQVEQRLRRASRTNGAPCVY